VVGIEYVEAAIEDAKYNARQNGISNSVFFAGDMKDVLNENCTKRNGKPDVVITDPPRAGMHPDVIARLLEMEPPRMVYISCNPATQARDLTELSKKYTITRIQPVDMFPHTHHVENVVELNLNISSLSAFN
jgi:23S rRNA (uracil1939-C5)-methyltransferase